MASTSRKKARFLSFSEAIELFKEFKHTEVFAIILIVCGGVLSWYANYLSAGDLFKSFGVGDWWFYWVLQLLIATALYTLLWVGHIRLYKAKLEENHTNRLKQYIVLTFLIFFNAYGLGVIVDGANGNMGKNSPAYVRAQEQIKQNNSLITSYQGQLGTNSETISTNSEARENTQVFYRGGPEKVAGANDDNKKLFASNDEIRDEIARLTQENKNLTQDYISPIESGTHVFVGGIAGKILGLWLVWWAVILSVVAVMAVMFDYVSGVGIQMIASAFVLLESGDDGIRIDPHLEQVVKYEFEKLRKLYLDSEDDADGGSSPSLSKAGQKESTVKTGPNGEKITTYHTKTTIVKNGIDKANAAKKSKAQKRRALMDDYISGGNLNDTQIAQAITQNHGINCDRSTVTRHRSKVNKSSQQESQTRQDGRGPFGRN